MWCTKPCRGQGQQLSTCSCVSLPAPVFAFHAVQRGVAVDQALQGQSERLAEITRDLKSCRSEFFIQEQAAQSRKVAEFETRCQAFIRIIDC